MSPTQAAPADLGARIRSARKRAGFTNQDTFAEALGTTRRNVVRWETGRNVPGARYRSLIVEATGQEDLFGEDGEEGE